MKSLVSIHLVYVLNVVSLTLNLFTQPGFASELTFKSPAATKAKERYQQSVTVISKRYIDELDRQLKFSMQAGQLEEANQIQEAKKQAAAGEPVVVDFKRPNLVAPRNV